MSIAQGVDMSSLNYLDALIRMHFMALVLAVVALVPLTTNAAALNTEEAAAWTEDFDYLVSELPKLHKNAYFQVSEDEFNSHAKHIRELIPTYDREHVIAGLCRQVALIGDSHTSLNIYSDPAGIRFFPLQLVCFSDGWRVIASSPDAKQAIGCTPVAIGGMPIDDAAAKIRTAFCFSNDSGALAQLPSLLVNGPVLYGVGVTDDPLAATWTFLDEDGKQFDLYIGVMSPGSTQGWPTVWDGREQVTPMCRQQTGNPYYYIWNPDLSLLYFQYNSCRERDDLSFADFSDMLFEAFDQYPYTKFVIDLRYNSGGNSGIADPLIDRLAADERVNQPGKIFVVTGRHTFSSAVLNALSLKQKTEAVFVGEPTGGSPNHYGELQFLTLPNSGIKVSYSTKYFKWTDDNSDAIYPEIATPVSFDDYLAGIDPALEAVLAY